jgi:hypothetical protein
MSKRTEQIVAEKQEAIIENLSTTIMPVLPQIIDDRAVKRVDKYHSLVAAGLEESGYVPKTPPPILSEYIRKAIKSKITGEPCGVKLNPTEDEDAQTQADNFVDREAEFFTDPDKYQEL